MSWSAVRGSYVDRAARVQQPSRPDRSQGVKEPSRAGRGGVEQRRRKIGPRSRFVQICEPCVNWVGSTACLTTVTHPPHSLTVATDTVASAADKSPCLCGALLAIGVYPGTARVACRRWSRALLLGGALEPSVNLRGSRRAGPRVATGPAAPPGRDGCDAGRVPVRAGPCSLGKGHHRTQAHPRAADEAGCSRVSGPHRASRWARRWARR